MLKVRIGFQPNLKQKYRHYSPTKLTNAYKAVLDNGTAVRKAARLYGVPLTTLRDRVDNRVSVDVVKSGRDAVLSQLEEARLIQHLDYMSDLGYGYSRTQVMELASDLAVHLHKRDKSQPLGRMWFDGFKKRWPQVSVTKPRSLSSIRAKAASPETIHSYYTELEKYLEKYDLKSKPESIYNIDEKGICTEHHPPYVVSSCTITPQAVTSPRGKTTTILGCGNAIGQQLPPYYVFAGVRKLDHLLDGTLPGSDLAMSETGWSNSEIFETYLKEHFYRYARLQEGEHLLVLYDGHTSHVTLSLIEWAKEHDIILFVLPPHCSHILQPLDIGCFGPLESAYNKECSAFLRQNVGQEICRLNVGKISSKAYSLALSPENLRASFRKAGIFPFDPSAVPESKLKPSSVYNQVEPMETQDDTSHLNPPNPVLSSLPPTQLQESPSAVLKFFQDKSLKIAPAKKKKTIRTLSKVVGRKAITGDDILNNIKELKKNTSKCSKKSKSSSCKASKCSKKSKSPSCKANTTTSVPKSPLPGPSRFYVSNTDPDSDTDSDSNTEGDCCICHKNSPPGLRDCLDLVIVKWALCDARGHWTHLRFCSEVRVVRRHSEFKCPHCL